MFLERMRVTGKCMDFKVEDVRPRGTPKKNLTENIENYCQTQQLCKEDAMDHGKCRKLIKNV